MIFSLEILRARKGDCLLLHYGTTAKPALMLIDGGPSQVYTPFLKPRLAAIRKTRGLADHAALVIDRVMISHIDDDHINGVLELTAELVTAKSASRPLPVKIRDAWHNTFDDIVGNTSQEIRRTLTRDGETAALASELDLDGFSHETALVLASVGQGFRLRDDLKRLNVRLNPEAHGHVVMASAETAPLDMGNGLSFLVAGPMREEILALQKEHDTFLKAQGSARTKMALASFTDTSIPNLSSIVVLATAGDKTILFTGDARGDKILQGLELVGALKPRQTLHVDVLKMPHHGSDRNMAQVFLERVVADHYVFSGDGEHGNPERATLEMLRKARGTARYAIHLTYPLDEIDAGRKRDWEKEQRKEQTRHAQNPDVTVRKNWSAATHGLVAFFAAHPDMAARLKIVHATTPHLITLLDRV